MMHWAALGLTWGCLYIPRPSDTDVPVRDSGQPTNTDDTSPVGDDTASEPDDSGKPDDTGNAPEPCTVDISGLAVVPVTDTYTTEPNSERALWICNLAHVDLTGTDNLAIVDPGGSVAVTGDRNSVVAYSNAMAASYGGDNQLVREAHTLAKGHWYETIQCTEGVRIERDGKEAQSPC